MRQPFTFIIHVVYFGTGLISRVLYTRRASGQHGPISLLEKVGWDRRVSWPDSADIRRWHQLTDYTIIVAVCLSRIVKSLYIAACEPRLFGHPSPPRLSLSGRKKMLI